MKYKLDQDSQKVVIAVCKFQTDHSVPNINCTVYDCQEDEIVLALLLQCTWSAGI